MRALAPPFRCGGLWLAAAIWLCLTALAVAQNFSFPPLSGRVVDAAKILSPETIRALDQKLAELEQKSSIQLEVATVSSLQGADIESFANALFRNWGLGEKVKNNGVLLLVAPKEKKIRIEVGYGLEGVLTDALSKLVIVNAIAPRFKAGDFSGGISHGVDEIIAILTTDSNEWSAKPELREDRSDDDGEVIIYELIAAALLLGLWLFRPTRSFVVFLLGSNWSNQGGSSNGKIGSGGWFSGGGGSSGGGGASGGW